MTIFLPMLGMSRPGRSAIDLIGALAPVYKRMPMYLGIALTVLEFTADSIVEFNPTFSFRGWDTALKASGMATLVVMTLSLKRRFRLGFCRAVTRRREF